MWYLLRHPQTKLNKEQKYHGWGYAPFSDLGEQQFTNSLKYSKSLKANIVLSSDLKRCLNLAQQISIVNKLPLVKSNLLRELNFGVWHGNTYNYLSKTYPSEMKKWVEDPWNNSPIAGETLKELENRCRKFKEQYENENAIIVTHGGVIALFQYLIKQEEYWKLLPKNSDCILIDWKNRKVTKEDISQ